MRKIEVKHIKTYVGDLKCQKCGRTETFYFGSDKSDAYWPESWNGWDLNNKEICPVCSANILIKRMKDVQYEIS